MLDSKSILHADRDARNLAQTQNINVAFDNPKYRQLRLRAFYAIPKMVVIPSAAALRKQKLQHVIDSTPSSEALQVSLVRSLLASGSARSACALVVHWQLQKSFPPPKLMERLLQVKSFSAAVRFAREFGLCADHPLHMLLHRMIEHKRYEGALKQVDKRAVLVDGHRSPFGMFCLLL